MTLEERVHGLRLHVIGRAGRWATRQRRLLHLDCRQRVAQRAAIPNTVHTKKYPTPTSAVSRPCPVWPVLPTA